MSVVFFDQRQNSENDYMDQRLACTAPKPWSKNTTHVIKLFKRVGIGYTIGIVYKGNYH